MSKNRRLCLVGVALGVVGLLTVAAPDAVAAPAPTSTLGQFVPLPTARVYDSGSVNVGLGPTVVQVAGKGGVPATATAVVVNTEVYAPTAAGYVRLTPAGTSPGVATQEFTAGQTISNLSTVKLAGGRVQVLVSAGRARIMLDVSGYYTDEPGVAGATRFNPLPSSRVFSSGSVSGSGVTVPLAGHGGIPADASAVVVNTEVFRPTGAGYVRVTPAGSTAQVATQEFARGQAVSNLVTVSLSGGAAQVRVVGAAGPVSAQVFMDVAGYYGGGGGSFVPLAAARVFASSPGGVGGTPVRIGAAGLAGIPASATAIAVNVEVSGPSAAGYLRVTPYNTDAQVATQEFVRGQSVSNLAVVSLNSGALQAKLVGATGQVFVDVAGYFTGPVTVPGATTSRYVNDLTAIAGAGPSGEGCTDAQTAPKLVLLQIGAQTVHAPLSPANPGVKLIGTPDDRGRYSYADLVTALDGYLAGFAACEVGGVTTTIAIGTSNDGYVGSPYGAAARGSDWATKVVDAVASHSGIVIAGADDIESGWDSNAGSTEAQAEQWVTAFLGATGASLINNGAAITCPDTYRQGGDCQPVLGQQGPTWTRADYVRLSYGLGPGRISVLPQVYFWAAPDQATAWANIDLTSGGKLTFAGALTQVAACGGPTCSLTPSAGWSSLYAALTAIGVPAPGAVATDIRYG